MQVIMVTYMYMYVHAVYSMYMYIAHQNYLCKCSVVYNGDSFTTQYYICI